ncbi:hypothetical protein [Kitasatospora paranensis]|uniref:Uncharacterized protein n=1 Tax=Kitasatospora paranensis TaxID=258053 RepID=A0ABW2G4B5_9ACTN
MDVLPDLLAALPALDAGLDPGTPWPLRRVELPVPSGASLSVGDPLGGGGYVLAAPRGLVAYLVLGGDAERTEVVAALLRHGETLPVEADEDGDRLDTDSGVLLVHAFPDGGPAALLARALTAARRPGGEGSRAGEASSAGERGRAGHPAAGSERAGVSAGGAVGLPDDFAEGWLSAADGPALALLVDPDGLSVTGCRDVEGREVALLLHR